MIYQFCGYYGNFSIYALLGGSSRSWDYEVILSKPLDSGNRSLVNDIDGINGNTVLFDGNTSTFDVTRLKLKNPMHLLDEPAQTEQTLPRS